MCRAGSIDEGLGSARMLFELLCNELRQLKPFQELRQLVGNSVLSGFGCYGLRPGR